MEENPKSVNIAKNAGKRLLYVFEIVKRKDLNHPY